MSAWSTGPRAAVREPPYGFGTTLFAGHEDAVRIARTALAQEGFGIVSEIDLARTLREKLGVDIPPYLLLGVCNPALARQALEADPDIGLLLPCTVAIRAAEEPGQVHLLALDPIAALAVTNRTELAPLAREVRERLERAIRTAEDILAHGGTQ
ncbi:MAG TPA: DUF302 domain-containing protein [Gemmatimonadales bacterium]|jgi:uncharacterized protein (DUF302 family)|nr:DUF302 domain-containing protein [Gemmatimonadales bacterium]